mmetsp:Transcript_56786/g.183936  ORF Transcript_56786/g.183936 Transcript_56786/m.183936 type:complete len:293 (-) Transcript_56786:260-1138(-)
MQKRDRALFPGRLTSFTGMVALGGDSDRSDCNTFCTSTGAPPEPEPAAPPRGTLSGEGEVLLAELQREGGLRTPSDPASEMGDGHRKPTGNLSKPPTGDEPPVGICGDTDLANIVVVVVAVAVVVVDPEGVAADTAQPAEEAGLPPDCGGGSCRLPPAPPTTEACSSSSTASARMSSSAASSLEPVAPAPLAPPLQVAPPAEPVAAADRSTAAGAAAAMGHRPLPKEDAATTQAAWAARTSNSAASRSSPSVDALPRLGAAAHADDDDDGVAATSELKRPSTCEDEVPGCMT